MFAKSTILIYTLFKFVQPEKAPYAMLVTELDMVIEVRLVQPSKALLAMLFTEFGMEIDVSPVQL